MPIVIGDGGGSGSGGDIFVDQLPAPEEAKKNTTYGRTSDEPVSLWKIKDVDPSGTLAAFADNPDYKGVDDDFPAAPTLITNYFFRSTSENFRISNTAVTAWGNLAAVDTINDYLPDTFVWIDGRGRASGRGSYDNDAAALSALAVRGTTAGETYVFYNRDTGTLRTIAALDFVAGGTSYVGVASGTGPVPGPTGPAGPSIVQVGTEFSGSRGELTITLSNGTSVVIPGFSTVEVPLNFYVATRNNINFVGSDFTIESVNGLATIPSYNGNKYWAIAWLDAGGDPSTLYYDGDDSYNGLQDFTGAVTTLIPTGETEAYQFMTLGPIGNRADTTIELRT